MWVILGFLVPVLFSHLASPLGIVLQPIGFELLKMIVCSIITGLLVFTQKQALNCVRYIGIISLACFGVAAYHVLQGAAYIDVFWYDTGFYWGYGFLFLVIALAGAIDQGNEESIRKMFLGVSRAVPIVGIYAVVQFLGWDYIVYEVSFGARVFSTLGNPAALALFFILWGTTNVLWNFRGMLFFIILGIICMTQTYAFLALWLGYGIYIFFPKKYRWYTIIFSSIGVVCAAILFGDRYISAQIRLELWAEMIRLFIHNPIALFTGLSPENLLKWQEFGIPHVHALIGENDSIGHVHMLIGEMLLRFGILPVILLGIWIKNTFSRSINEHVRISLVIFFLASFWHIPDITHWFLLFLGIRMNQISQKEYQGDEQLLGVADSVADS